MNIYRVAYLLFSIFITMVYLVPQVRALFPLDRIAFLTFAYAIIYIFPKKEITIWKRSLLYITPFVLIMYLVTWDMDFHYGFLLTVMNMWIYLFPGFLFASLITRNNKIEKISFGIALLVILAVIMSSSYNAMQENEVIMRSLANGNIDEDVKNYYIAMGVGGYGFSYATGLLTIAMFAGYSLSNKKLIKYIALASFAILFFFVLSTKYATLLVCTFVVLMSIIFIKSNRTNKVIIIILVPLLYFAFGLIFPLIINALGDSVLTSRLQEVYMAFYGGGVGQDSDMASRAYYREQCLSNIITSPIWGHNTTGDLRHLYTHAHSTFWSYFLGTGLIGIVSYMMTYWMVLRNGFCHLKNDKVVRVFLIPSYIYFFMLAFFNATEYTEIAFALLFVVPFICNFIFKNISYETLEK